MGLHQALQQEGEGREEVDVRRGDALLEVLAHEGDATVDGAVEHVQQPRLGVAARVEIESKL